MAGEGLLGRFQEGLEELLVHEQPLDHALEALGRRRRQAPFNGDCEVWTYRDGASLPQNQKYMVPVNYDR